MLILVDQLNSGVFTIGIDDTLFAIDGDSGKTVWQKSFPNSLKPVRPATSNCANTEQATPVIDKKRGVIYFTTSDGKLRGADLTDADLQQANVHRARREGTVLSGADTKDMMDTDPERTRAEDFRAG